MKPAISLVLTALFLTAPALLAQPQDGPSQDGQRGHRGPHPASVLHAADSDRNGEIEGYKVGHA